MIRYYDFLSIRRCGEDLPWVYAALGMTKMLGYAAMLKGYVKRRSVRMYLM
jgi:hypothetical protein